MKEKKQCQALLFLRECDRPRLTLEYKGFALKSQAMCFKFDRFKNIDLTFFIVLLYHVYCSERHFNHNDQLIKANLFYFHVVKNKITI